MRIMKSKTKAISLCLLIVFSCAVTKAQEKTGEPICKDDEIRCAHRYLITLIQVSFSVRSSKKGYLKNLTYKDFEVYERSEIQEIDYFIFDKSKNRYVIGFYPTKDKTDSEKYDVKIKVKLSKRSREEYGKISVELLRA